jgi:hypothetical protein
MTSAEQVMEASRPVGKVALYRHIEPAAPYHPGSNWEKVGEEYMGFQIVREGEYRLFVIKLSDGSIPPVPLRGSWNLMSRVKAHIDGFLGEEERDKELNAKLEGNQR